MSRPDKYEVIGKIPVSELTGVTEAVEISGSGADVADALRSRVRSGEGLSVPYARRWEVGGYVASWQWDVHGEAGDDEFVRRAANATQSVIEAKRAHDG